jgi:hypothetical protein
MAQIASSDVGACERRGFGAATSSVATRSGGKQVLKRVASNRTVVEYRSPALPNGLRLSCGRDRPQGAVVLNEQFAPARAQTLRFP